MYVHTCICIQMHAYIHINNMLIILYIQTPNKNLRAKIILLHDMCYIPCYCEKRMMKNIEC